MPRRGTRRGIKNILSHNKKPKMKKLIVASNNAGKIKEIKEILTGIPLNITLLNTKLDEAIDFIYKLYNNVNNVVGMALMVENAIVFGNKYRSSYPEVDAELSKAEFAYLNGEYTQSLTIAIACIEKLFPKSGDDKIMEYAKGVQ